MASTSQDTQNKDVCPYNSKIQCNAFDRFNEIYRQMQEAYNKGNPETFIETEDDCPVHKAFCLRYLDAQKTK